MEKDYSAIIAFLEQQGGNFQKLAERNAGYAITKIVMGLVIATIVLVIALIVAINTYKYVSALFAGNEILSKKTGKPVSDNWHIVCVIAFIVSVFLLIVTTVLLIKLPIKLTEYIYVPEIKLLSDIFGKKNNFWLKIIKS